MNAPVRSDLDRLAGLGLRLEHRPVDALIPYARNARTHSEAQVALIAGSIREFGFTNPVLVDGESGIIAGHGRLLAARQLGLRQVPVIELAHLTPAQKRALVLADNKLAERAGWDEQLLALEAGELAELGVDLSTLGFEAGEIDDLLHGDAADPREEETPEVPADPVSRPGDLWLCGTHRVLCGDATVITDLERLMAGRKADLCFADSPYNVDYAGGVGAEKAGKGRRILNDALGDGFERFLYDACVSIIAHTAGAIYMCMSSSELHTLQKAFVAAGGHWSTFIIWAKDRFTLGRSDYQRQFEPILYGWPKGGKHHWCGARDQGDVWFIDRPSRNDLHPTMKPVDLVERAIQNSSPPGGVVLDPFGGSGTTLIAAERTGRAARLMELDPAYVDVIIERWQGFTGKAATLEGDGRSFAEVAAERRPS
ncbi:DNA modification methylase [Amaricoccus macauensis]|uniref:Methyltransferase n=1 Tax=Amaricoccus macauensis TaxID=57001 RepID=A0A840SHW6_9RHOB|nr:site-specific DNA-methyltransferase [Amaricoccus macauensis]MBB5220350.1 DNA modification methylase [Amaricoccus macauensis]